MTFSSWASYQRTFEFRAGRVLQPITTLEVDVSAFAEALGFIGADVSDIAIEKIEGKLREVVQSKTFQNAVASYLTEGFVHIVQQGHVFQDLLVEPNRFVVLHIDPHPDKPPEPAQPAEVDFPRPKSVKARPTTKDSRINLEKIDHIVVLMQENRSFDHMLGYLSHPNHGLRRLQNDPERDVPDGLSGDESNPRSDGGRAIVMKPYATTDINFNGRVLPPTATPFGPHHEHAHVIDQMAEGSMLGFADDFISRFPNADPQFAMSFYTDEHLPVFDELAANYTICDRWFSSHPGPTQPNRFCTLSGHTPVLDNFAVDDPILGYLQMPTMFEVLSDADIDWVYYEGDIGFLRTYDRYRLDDQHVIPFDDRNDGFLRRADLGLLPRVTFIDPNFTDVPPAATANDDHAPADLALGQRLIKQIHDALASSVHWSRMLFVITYDEHGGFYDHVAPPGTQPAEQPKPVRPVHPRGNRFYGPRVPTFVISPFVGAGKVSHTVFDHTSIMATILRRFIGQVSPQFGPRAAVANDLGSLLDLAQARRPRRLSSVTSAPVSGRLIDTRPDPSDFHALMRTLAQPKRG